MLYHADYKQMLHYFVDKKLSTFVEFVAGKSNEEPDVVLNVMTKS